MQTRLPGNYKAEVFLARWSPGLWVIDPFILAFCFFDLGHRITGVRVGTMLRNEQIAVSNKQLHFSRGFPNAVIRHEQQFKNVRIRLRQ